MFCLVKLCTGPRYDSQCLASINSVQQVITSFIQTPDRKQILVAARFPATNQFSELTCQSKRKFSRSCCFDKNDNSKQRKIFLFLLPLGIAFYYFLKNKTFLLPIAWISRIDLTKLRLCISQNKIFNWVSMTNIMPESRHAWFHCLGYHFELSKTKRLFFDACANLYVTREKAMLWIEKIDRQILVCYLPS